MRTFAFAVWLLVAPAAAAERLHPDASAPIVAELVVRFMEQAHYSRPRVDDTAARQMLRNYIEFFDFNHMVLSRADVDEFELLYQNTLDDRLRRGDVSPAYFIFDRIKTRMDERVALVKRLLDSTFTFTTDETFAVDRTKAPWPAGPQESDELWRLRVKYEVLQERLNGATPEEQIKTVRKRYEQAQRTLGEYDTNEVLQAYLSALSHSFDPHSDYMAPAQAENFNIGMRLSLQGIGAVLRSEEGYAKIVSLVPGGPADRDKRLKPNDRIEAVAQGDAPWVETLGMNLERVVQMIRGEKGTTVRLRVLPSDALDPATRVVVTLVRDEIKLTEQEARAKVLTVPGRGKRPHRVGLLTLPEFYSDMRGGRDAKSTTRDVERLLVRLKQEKIEGLILDLRRNGGGSLKEAVALTGLFIPQGPVVQVKDTQGAIQLLEDTEPGTEFGGPLVVLTSRASASASEILAGAMQDYGRAVVVGEKSTFGKGTVQAMVDLANYLPPSMRSLKPGSLKLTIQKFYRVSGASTQNRGVIPDIRVPSMTDEADFSESSQKNALPYDEVAPAPHQKLDAILPPVSVLKKSSEERVRASKEFAWVVEDVRTFKKQTETKTVSLNEATRLSEKKAQEARDQERKKERAARKEKPFEEGPDITIGLLDGKPVPKPSPTPTPTPKPGEKKEDYEKAPPSPDIVLHEGVAVLTDMLAADLSGAAPTAGSQLRTR
ncbi:MAG: carboxy terminal-processing peptidase [Elusimicrobia bacterium]|nr:carboxy terminal-processing peptidase [Elusimicrobiota bacterium]